MCELAKVRKANQIGSVLPVAAAVLIVLIMLSLGVIAVAYRYLTSQEQQYWADKVAFELATKIVGPDCPDLICFQLAKKDAQILLEHAPIKVNQQASNESDPKIIVEFGRKISLEDDTFEVISDEDNWQEHNPGFPQIIAINAVRIIIKNSGLPILNKIFPYLSSSTTQSVVLLAPIGSGVNIAPFAVSVCSFVNAESKGLHQYGFLDTNFTEVNRHCANKNDCYNTPAFFYDIPTLDSLFAPPATVASISVTGNNITEVSKIDCGFGAYNLPNPAGNYGVVGLANADSVPTEDDIKVAFLNPESRYRYATLGNDFNILGSGLTSKDSAKYVWDAITGKYVGDPLINPSWQSVFSFNNAGLELNVNASWLNLGEINYQEQHGECLSMDHIPPQGVCNSERMGFGLGSADSYAPPGEVALSKDRWFTTMPVFKTAVPVIANRAGPPCRGYLEATADPYLDPHETYEIVGFLPVVIYDMDIGNPPPPSPDHMSGQPQIYSNLIPQLPYATNYLTDIDSSDPKFKFSFDRPCNLVRGRVSSIKSSSSITTTELDPDKHHPIFIK